MVTPLAVDDRPAELFSCGLLLDVLYIWHLQNTVLEHCQHCLKVFPLDDLVAHALNCSQRKDIESLVSIITLYYCKALVETQASFMYNSTCRMLMVVS